MSLTHASVTDCWLRAFLFVVASLMAGCQMTPAPSLVSCPLPQADQARAILDIAPLDTPRDEVVERLKKAGFAGNFGENNSIFYCDIWDKGEGIRWHVNVSLLFDEEGRLYATRPDSQGQTPLSPKSAATAATAKVPDPFEVQPTVNPSL